MLGGGLPNVTFSSCSLEHNHKHCLILTCYDGISAMFLHDLGINNLVGTKAPRTVCIKLGAYLDKFRANRLVSLGPYLYTYIGRTYIHVLLSNRRNLAGKTYHIYTQHVSPVIMTTAALTLLPQSSAPLAL